MAPAMTLDLRGLMAANYAASEGLEKLAHRYGNDSLQAVMSGLITLSEQRMRRRLHELPDGTIESIGYLAYEPRTGTIPVSLRNDAGRPVRVRVLFDSDKLEFRDGESLEVTLTDETTRLDVRVRTLASGASPLDITVTSPDSGVHLANARYTVRSTAVSGVGLVLSLGAGVFLLVWWARHWRDARRSRRLVPPDPQHLRRA